MEKNLKNSKFIFVAPNFELFQKFFYTVNYCMHSCLLEICDFDLFETKSNPKYTFEN